MESTEFVLILGRGVDVRLCICHIKKINKHDTVFGNNSGTHKFDLSEYLTNQPKLDKMKSRITIQRYANDHCLYHVQRTFFSVKEQGEVLNLTMIQLVLKF